MRGKRGVVGEKGGWWWGRRRGEWWEGGEEQAREAVGKEGGGGVEPLKALHCIMGFWDIESELAALPPVPVFKAYVLRPHA